MSTETLTPYKEQIEGYTAWLYQQFGDHPKAGERFQHSLGAYEKAVELADKFQLSPQEKEQACIAALLHDAAKLMGPDPLTAYAEQHGLAIEPIDRQTPQTMHPMVGAEIVRQEFGIEDPDILNAIRFHTTGRAGMSQIEMLVFIADKIEGNTRNPLYIQKMTAHLNPEIPNSLALTVLYILDSTIQFLLEKRQLIHPRTLEARNDIVHQLDMLSFS